jgi:cytochrome c peroxidase
MSPRAARWRDAVCAVLLAAGAASGCRGGQRAAAASSAAGSATPAPPLPKLAAYIPPSTRPDPARVALGRLLFFDARLSGDGTTSCATCHDPARGFTDGRAKAHGKGGKVLRRNTPSVVNVDGRAPMFWDGRAATAEDQALMPVKNPDEMARDLPSLIAELEQTPEYRARFKRAFGDGTIDGDRIARAVADFERTLISAGAPLDRYLGGDATAMSPAALRGMSLFTGRAACVKCHSGPQLTDGSFHNIGLAGVAADQGRYEVVPIAVSRGAFKTPGLRDVVLTAPYFHDGSAATLRDVVDHYKRGGVVKDNLDADIKPLSLSDGDEQDLIEFMRALSGVSRPTDIPRVPVARPRPTVRLLRDLMRTNDRTLREIDPAGAGPESAGDLRLRGAAQSALALVENAEQIPALLGNRPDVRAHRRELDERVGELIVALSDLRELAQKGQADEMTAAYDQVRDRCEACHDRFRWTHGARAR